MAATAWSNLKAAGKEWECRQGPEYGLQAGKFLFKLLSLREADYLFWRAVKWSWWAPARELVQPLHFLGVAISIPSTSRFCRLRSAS
jgi:hypothetical protein